MTSLPLFYLNYYKQKKEVKLCYLKPQQLRLFSFSPDFQVSYFPFHNEVFHRKDIGKAHLLYQTAHVTRLHSLLVKYADGKLSVDPEFSLFVLAKLNFLSFPCGWLDAFGDSGLSWARVMFKELFSRNRALWFWIASPAGHRNEKQNKTKNSHHHQQKNNGMNNMAFKLFLKYVFLKYKANNHFP